MVTKKCPLFYQMLSCGNCRLCFSSPDDILPFIDWEVKNVDQQVGTMAYRFSFVNK